MGYYSTLKIEAMKVHLVLYTCLALSLAACPDLEPPAPVRCEENEIHCFMFDTDANGCPIAVPDMCMPDAPCPAHCPLYCGSQEHECLGDFDEDLCRLPSVCSV